MTNRQLITYFLPLVLFASIVILYVNSKAFLPLEKHSVSIAVSKTPLSAPFYVAQAINAFDDTCVKVEFDEVLGGQVAFAKVLSGEVDFGTTSDSVIAFQSLTKKSFVTHTMFVQSDNDVKLLSRPSAQISSATDLKGKRVGVTKGTASEYFLSMLLALEGLTTEDVNLHHYQPDQLVDGYINNEIDAMVPWEPFAFQSIQLLEKEVKVHDTKSLNSLSFHLISQAADRVQVEKAKCIIQGLNTAIDYIAAKPRLAKKIIIEKLQLSDDFIEWVWPDYIFKLSLNQSLVLSLKAKSTWLVATQMSQFNGAPKLEKFIDTRALLQVQPGAVNIP